MGSSWAARRRPPRPSSLGASPAGTGPPSPPRATPAASETHSRSPAPLERARRTSRRGRLAAESPSCRASAERGLLDVFREKIQFMGVKL